MCLFFPGHPPLILSSKSIYLPCKVLIDRKLEHSEWCQLKTSLSKQSSHASPWSPQAEPKEECMFLSQPQGLVQELPLFPTSTAFAGRWFFRKQMPVVEAWNSTAQLQEVCDLIQPKNNFIRPPITSLHHPLPTPPLHCKHSLAMHSVFLNLSNSDSSFVKLQRAWVSRYATMKVQE